MLWKIYLLELFTDKYRPNHVANLYLVLIFPIQKPTNNH